VSIFAIIGSILFGLVILGMGLLRNKPLLMRPSAREAQALLAALAAPDNIDLPTLRTQPDPAIASPDLAHRRRMGPLLDLKLAPETQQWWRGIGNYAVLAGVLLNTAWLLGLETVVSANTQTYAQYDNSYQYIVNILFAPLVIYFICMGYFFLSKYAFRGWRLWADEQGLLWPRFWRWERLVWADIRTIGCYLGSTGLTYVIAGERQVITWRFAATIYQQRTEAGAVRLLTLAMAHTGLPLRDLTPLAAALAQAANEQSLARLPAGYASPAIPAADDVLRERAAVLLAAVPPLPAPTRWYVNAGIAVLLGALLWLPPGIAHYTYSVALPNYLATLPAQIQRQTPLLADSLSAPDGRWPIHTPTKTDQRRMVYSDGGYTLSGSHTGDEIDSVLPAIYHAVAIQVTVTERGAIPPGATDGVGIIMRWSTADHDNCAFVVDYAGDWNDTCSFEQGGGNGLWAFIRRGPDATNTLLVIVRGQQQIMYANGHFIGMYFAEFTAPLGQIGLVNEESGMAATFTDFTVWPVTSPPDPNYD
jgi:hypothetical protein